MSESWWLPPSSTSVSVTAKTLELVILYPLLLFLLFVITVFLFSSQPEYKIADPICTFLFSVLVVGTTLPITKDVFRILMEGKHWVFVMKISFSLTAGCAFVTPSVGFVFFPCRHSSGRPHQHCERAAAVCERSHRRPQPAHVEPQHDSLFTLGPRGRR